MKSKASIADHPIHPILVTIPIGAFSLLLIGDIGQMVTNYDPYWSRFAFDCLVVGVISALIAATFGLIDYLSVNMSSAGRRLATYHMITNVSAVMLYAIGGWLRWSYGSATNLWVLKFILDIVPFAMLGFSGWLGGKMSYQHKIGVVENYDLEATDIGQRESDSSGARQRYSMRRPA